MKLSIKAITISERLLGQSFLSMNFVDADTVDVLMYAMSLNDGETHTLKGFKLLMKNSKHRRRMENGIDGALLFLSQFKPNSAPDEEDKKETQSVMTVTEMANILIANGIDAHYVMNEMHVFEIEGLMSALSDKKKERLEEKRLWTFYGLLPYAGKDMKKPTDLILFPWEEEAQKKNSEAEFEKGVQLFEKFIKSEPIKKTNDE